MPSESHNAELTPQNELNEIANPASIQRIVLTGFMGAGKSTIGRLLARQLDWRFIDADDEIEAAAGATIAELFRKRGEPWFRQLEHETILRLVSAERLVLALGGGAIEDDRTRRLLLAAQGTRLIHLDARLETVLTRCNGTDALRPVLQDRANLEARYLKRLPFYRESHLSVAVDSLPPRVIVETILGDLRKHSETTLPA
jgi:shikimate kinase